MTPGFDRIGVLMMACGVGLVILGGLIWLAARLFPNLSQLPGTIRIQGAGFTCVFPLLASIVISIVLTILLNVIIRLLNR